MAGNNVEVKLTMVDNVSRKLAKIEANMNKVVASANNYTKAIGKLGNALASTATAQERFNRKLKAMDSTVGAISSSKALSALNNYQRQADRTRGIISKNIAAQKKWNDSISSISKVSSTAMGEYKRNTEYAKKSIGKTVAAQKKLNQSIKEMGSGIPNVAAYNRTVKDLSKNVSVASKEADTLNKRLKQTGTSSGSAKNGIDSLKSGIKGLIASYVGLNTVMAGINASDNLALQTAKLSQITDDVENLQNKIYQMSQDSRSDYMTNMSQIAKMGVNTNFGEANSVFGSEEELVQFNELLNKTFILGGSGVREMNASVYQLTQALSSGRLQGDELRSLIENAPMYANAIVDYMNNAYNAGKPLNEQVNLTIADIRALGAEGVITSDVMKNALLYAAEDIRKAYEDMPLTFAQQWQKLQNQMKKIAEPVLKQLNDIANSEAFEKIKQSLAKMFAMAMAFIYPILEGVKAVGNFISENWTIIEPIIWGIVYALGAYALWTSALWVKTKLLTVAHWAHLKALTVVNGVIKIGRFLMAAFTTTKLMFAMATHRLTFAQYGQAASTMAATAATYGLSTATWTAIAPLLVIIAVILAIIAIIYVVVWVYNWWTGETKSALGIIVGAFYWLYAGVYNVMAGIWNCIVDCVEWMVDKWNMGMYYLKSAAAGMGKGVLGIFEKVLSGVEWLVNGAIDIVNGLIDKVNSIPGINIGKLGKVELTSDVESAIKALEDWKIEKPTGKTDYSDKKAEYKNLDEYFQKGYDKGSEWEGNIGDFIGKLFGGFDMGLDGGSGGNSMAEEFYNSSLENYNPEDISGGDYGLGDDTLDAIKDYTGQTAENTKIASEDLKYLRDLAEQRVINRFTTAEIKITNHMNNSINSDRDLDGVVNYLTTEMYKAAHSTAEGLHY